MSSSAQLLERTGGSASGTRGIAAATIKGCGVCLSLHLHPLLHHISREGKNRLGRQLAVIIPEKLDKHWYNYFLHNKRATLLKTLLYFSRNQQIVAINVPWYLGDDR
jgi:AhpD family alkylhydroperoxidase